SLAVWAVPSPVPTGSRFTIMVGSKSSGACALKGTKVEIRDDAGGVVGEGTLGETPWPGTDALYWTEIALESPRREGRLCWSAAFAATDLALPHMDSAAEFSFTAARPPEHLLVVTVTESPMATPVAETQIALGPYRATTDKAGIAHIEVPAGTY